MEDVLSCVMVRVGGGARTQASLVMQFHTGAPTILLPQPQALPREPQPEWGATPRLS